MDYVYKVRRKSDGLYANKGMYGWSKTGGAWAKQAHVKNFIQMRFKNCYPRGWSTDPSDFEVVEVPVIYEERTKWDIDKFLDLPPWPMRVV